MDPRRRRWLLWAALVLLASGLLFSGAAHLALHASDEDHAASHDAGSVCEGCWLTSPEAPRDTGAYGHVHVLREMRRECVREARAIGVVLRADARGPPVG